VRRAFARDGVTLLEVTCHAGEAVIAIPPDGRDSGRGRIFLRIGGRRSVVDRQLRARSHERQHDLHDARGKQLFVSAEGTRYVIDAQSRTLVEEIGTEVAGVMRDDPMTLFVVDHNGMSLEAFGRTGRLWKTDPIGLRRISTNGDHRHQSRRRSAARIMAGVGRFFRETGGEVRFADAR
jgi:hypothetical protein